MDDDYEKAFDRAKRLSDFVGMFTRLAFLVLLTSFVGVQASRAEGISFAMLLCTLMMIGFFMVRLAWLVAGVITKAWTSYLISKLTPLIGRSSTFTIALAFWGGRIGGYVVMIAAIGLSISLIQYGDTLARKLVDETPAHTE